MPFLTFLSRRGQHDLRLPISSSLRVQLFGEGEGAAIDVSCSSGSFHAEVEARGHFRGHLTWDTDVLERIIPMDEPFMDVVVSFCYANTLRNTRTSPDYSIERVAWATRTSRGRLMPDLFEGCPYEGPFSIYAGTIVLVSFVCRVMRLQDAPTRQLSRPAARMRWLCLLLLSRFLARGLKSWLRQARQRRPRRLGGVMSQRGCLNSRAGGCNST
jgi:hypothetical protein